MSEEIREKFEFVLESILLINQRFSEIRFANDFIADVTGKTLLDSIAMRLQAIGDNIKSVKKRSPEILLQYPSVDWTNIIRMRDLISHHYDGLDHEIIYDICQKNIPELQKIVELIVFKHNRV